MRSYDVVEVVCTRLHFTDSVVLQCFTTLSVVYFALNICLKAGLEGSPRSGCNLSARSDVLLMRIVSLQQTSTTMPKPGRPLRPQASGLYCG